MDGWGRSSVVLAVTSAFPGTVFVGSERSRARAGTRALLTKDGADDEGR